MKRGLLDFEHLSFHEPFAHLSRTFRTSFANLSQICCTKSPRLIYMFTCQLSRLSRSLLLSRAFANQHFPFAQAPQINLHMKVNVGGFFRSSFDFKAVAKAWPTWNAFRAIQFWCLLERRKILCVDLRVFGLKRFFKEVVSIHKSKQVQNSWRSHDAKIEMS